MSTSSKQTDLGSFISTKIMENHEREDELPKSESEKVNLTKCPNCACVLELRLGEIVRSSPVTAPVLTHSSIANVTRIEEFKLDELAPLTNTYIIGPRASGKSTLAHELLRSCSSRFDEIVIIARTTKAIELHADVMPSDDCIFIASTYDELKSIYAYLIQWQEQNITSTFLILLDDICQLVPVSQRNTSIISDLENFGKHRNFTCIFTTQSLRSLHHESRRNADNFMFCGRMFDKESIKWLHEICLEFTNCPTSRPEFSIVYNTVTANFGTLVCCRRSQHHLQHFKVTKA
jgi:hypothetical protein